MLTDEQLAMRRTGLTATDMVKLSGASPWGSAHDVYADKIGAPSHAQNGAMRVGNDLEPIVLGWLARDRGITLTPGTTERHASMPWALATPDANVVVLPSNPQRVAIAEAKVVGLRQAARWSDDAPPDYVVVQNAWQMLVTGVSLVYVPALIGTELRIYEVHRDADLEGALVELGSRFWTQHVVARKPPTHDGSDGARRMLASVWPRESAGLVSAPSEAEDIARAWLEADRAEKAACAAKERAAQAMKSLLAYREGFVSPNFKVTWRWQKASHVAAHTREPQRRFVLKGAEGTE